ncbi:flavodoxin FldB [Motiliproteus coralliicola]|uniref:flavodoxin FldB n=1 Tax=Motiliproteus coralliicola TaxID=2283196 RepID=UPI001A9D6D3C
MKDVKIALIYGSTTGNTEDVAEKIQENLAGHEVQLFDVADASPAEACVFDRIIMGIPTWDYGEIQSEWEDVWEDLDELELNGKRIALFGLGDQIGYGDWFLDAMGKLHDKLVEAGAEMVGYWPNEGYDFSASVALTPDGKQFVGLALDEDCQSELTDERVSKWCKQVLAEF